jgi:hypothetical protein
MNVLTFSHQEFNYFFGRQDDYFLLFSSAEEPLLIRNRCPHRGGPLHLGEVDASGDSLICPWHGTKVRHAVLRRAALPLVSRAGSVTVVLDEPPGSLTPAHRMVLANQACGRCHERGPVEAGQAHSDGAAAGRSGSASRLH